MSSHLAQVDLGLEGIGETVSSLEPNSQLVFVVVLLIVLVFSLVSYVVYLAKITHTSVINEEKERENSYELIKLTMENSKEDRESFKKAIGAFSTTIDLLKQDRLDIKKWIELHDSSSAKRAENVREYFDKRFDEVIEKMENGDELSE